MGRRGGNCTGKVRLSFAAALYASRSDTDITGKAVSETDEKIPGSLKYNWTTGPSTAVAPIKIAAPLQQIQS